MIHIPSRHVGEVFWSLEQARTPIFDQDMPIYVSLAGGSHVGKAVEFLQVTALSSLSPVES